MSRIITGQAAGRRLQPVKGDQTRPTTDRVKEALFSRLEAWEMVSQKTVLDLFAGSGALGLEAASRGAEKVIFVEKSPVAFQALKTNVQLVGKAIGASMESHRSSAQTFLEKLEATRFDLVFIDPPYDFNEESLSKILCTLVPHLNLDAVVVIERGKRTSEPEWPDGLERLKPRRYGETVLYFAEVSDANSSA